MIIEDLFTAYCSLKIGIGQILSISYIPAPPKPNIFELVFSLSIMIVVIGLDILFVYIVFRKCYKSIESLKSFQQTSWDIKVSSIFLMLLGIPGLISGLLHLVFGGLYVFSQSGYFGLFFFVIGAIFTGVGVINLFMGIGLLQLNYTTWKGSIFLMIVFIFVNLLPHANVLYYRLILFPIYGGWWPESIVSLLNILPLLFLFCYFVVLACIASKKDQFLKSNLSSKLTTSTTLPLD
jgi:hypothetical protein